MDNSLQRWKKYIPNADPDTHAFYECVVEAGRRRGMTEIEMGALLNLKHQHAYIVTRIITTYFSKVHDTSHNTSTSSQQRLDTTPKAIEAVLKDERVKKLITDFARLIVTSGNSKVPVQVLEAVLKSLQTSQSFLSQNVGSAVDVVKGLGSFLYTSGQQVFQSVMPKHQQATNVSVAQQPAPRDFIIMEASESARPLQLSSEILSRGDVPGQRRQ